MRAPAAATHTDAGAASALAASAHSPADAARGFLRRKGEAARRRAAGAEAGRAGPGEDADTLRERALAAPAAVALGEALASGPTVALLAEFKRRSPSAGSLLRGESPADVARLYARSGARGVSVLTDEEDFGARPGDLAEAAREVDLPVLCKDFVVHEAQLFHARAMGASAALLIVALLEPDELRSLIAAGSSVGLECLVEVHRRAELRCALDAGATLIGINNRDLRTLRTSLKVTEQLVPLVPPGITVVSESGIRSPEDVARARDCGAQAVLVGEALLRHPPGERAALAEALAGVPR